MWLIVFAEYMTSNFPFSLIILSESLIDQNLSYVLILSLFVIAAKFLQGSTPIFLISLKCLINTPSLLPISRIDLGLNFFFILFAKFL